jgi:hypothetical protein
MEEPLSHCENMLYQTPLSEIRVGKKSLMTFDVLASVQPEKFQCQEKILKCHI